MDSRIIGLSMILGSCLLIWGCDDDDNGTTSPPPPTTRTATLQVNMVDQPTVLDSIVIVVDSVSAHIVTDTTLGDTLLGWYVLNRTRATYNLLELVNGATAVLGRDTVPPGRYDQIRLQLADSGHYVVDDGIQHPLRIPSGTQTGVKINIDTTLQAGFTYIITLDFDAGRSVHRTGSSMYLMRPVIKAVTMAGTGSISGTVAPDTARPSILAYAGVDSSTTFADDAGNFRLQFLAPATYTVVITPQDTTYADSTISNVMVVAGVDSSLGTIVLRAR